MKAFWLGVLETTRPSSCKRYGVWKATPKARHYSNEESCLKDVKKCEAFFKHSLRKVLDYSFMVSSFGLLFSRRFFLWFLPYHLRGQSGPAPQSFQIFLAVTADQYKTV